MGSGTPCDSKICYQTPVYTCIYYRNIVCVFATLIPYINNLSW